MSVLSGALSGSLNGISSASEPEAAPAVGVGRASFSPKEIAVRNACSETFVRQAIAEGRLTAHPLGGCGPLRVTLEAEALWIRGQHSPEDPPVVGVPASRAASYGARRRGK